MKVRFELLLVFLILVMSFIPAMWSTAIDISYSSSYMMKNYPDAAKWLVQNMDNNERALVPFIGVFKALEPDLMGRLIHYSDIWKGAGVFLEADNDLRDIRTVRSYMRAYVEQENVNYMLVSPNDPHSARLFESEIHDKWVLSEVIEFHSEGSLWNDPLTVYTYVQEGREILKLSFNSTEPPPKYHTRGNVTLSFGTGGMVIDYEKESGVYIPIFLNSSIIERLLLSVHLNETSSGVTGNMVLYLDKDGDGRWGGWDTDTGILIPLPKEASTGIEMEFSEALPKIGYDIIQVGIVVVGESQQTITVLAITFHEVYEPGE